MPPSHVVAGGGRVEARQGGQAKQAALADVVWSSEALHLAVLRLRDEACEVCGRCRWPSLRQRLLDVIAVGFPGAANAVTAASAPSYNEGNVGRVVEGTWGSSSRRPWTPGAASSPMCCSGSDRHRRSDMNHQQVRDIAEAAFKARFGDIGIVSIDVKPGFDHCDDPMLDVHIVYDAEVERLIAPDKAPDMVRVRSEIVEKVWAAVQNSPGYPYIHFIAKSDLEEDPATA